MMIFWSRPPSSPSSGLSFFQIPCRLVTETSMDGPISKTTMARRIPAKHRIRFQLEPDSDSPVAPPIPSRRLHLQLQAAVESPHPADLSTCLCPLSCCPAGSHLPLAGTGCSLPELLPRSDSIQSSRTKPALSRLTRRSPPLWPRGFPASCL